MSGLPSRLYNRVKKLVFPGPAGSALYKIWNWQKQKFKCPLCNYQGPFYDVDTAKHEHCPRCGANERTRLQYLVIEKLRATYPLSKMSLLHFAPEDAFVAYFRGIFQKYTSADLVNPRVDHQVRSSESSLR